MTICVTFAEHIASAAHTGHKHSVKLIFAMYLSTKYKNAAFCEDKRMATLLCNENGSVYRKHVSSLDDRKAVVWT